MSMLPTGNWNSPAFYPALPCPQASQTNFVLWDRWQIFGHQMHAHKGKANEGTHKVCCHHWATKQAHSETWQARCRPSRLKRHPTHSQHIPTRSPPSISLLLSSFSFSFSFLFLFFLFLIPSILLSIPFPLHIYTHYIHFSHCTT